MVSRGAGGWVGRRMVEKVCPGCISKTVTCRKLILGRDIGLGCWCVMSLCDYNLTFVLAIATLNFNILSRQYL